MNEDFGFDTSLQSRPQTESDKRILDSYCVQAEFFSRFLGSNCESLVQHLSSLDDSVIAIFNGGLTGRKIGAPLTNRGLEILRHYKKTRVFEPIITSSPSGHFLLRAITTPILNENELIGLWCVNVFLDSSQAFFFKQALEESASSPFQKLGIDEITTMKKITFETPEVFSSSADETLVSLIDPVIHTVSLDKNFAPRQKTREIVDRLYHQRFFSFKQAVETLAKHLGVSKDIVYAHLRNIKKTEENS